MTTAKENAEALASAIRGLGYSTSEVTGGPHSTPANTYSFWVFRKFEPGERGSKTYTAKKLAMLRIDEAGGIFIEREWEPGTRKIIDSLGMGKYLVTGGHEKKPPRERESPDYKRGASGRFGASMGRTSDLSYQAAGKLRLERVPINSGGYDPGGAYWGSGQPLFLATSEEDGRVRYLRAPDRDAAKKQFPNARFAR